VSITSDIVDPILRLSGLPAYALVSGLVFSEAALFVGFVLPGETAVILGGVLAYRHSVSLPLMAVIVVLSAIVGDSVGYEVGRHYGSRLLGLKILQKHQKAIESGRASLHRNSGRAVFLSRFTAFLRAVMPGLAGTFGVPYRRFLTFNAAGGLVWGLGFVLLGYLAGASYQRLENYAGRASEIILAVVVVAAIALTIRRRRAERRAEREPTDHSEEAQPEH
jgi:membrane protein DedA with SNARE-associated domain